MALSPVQGGLRVPRVRTPDATGSCISGKDARCLVVGGRAGTGLTFAAVVGFRKEVLLGGPQAPDGDLLSLLATQLTGQRHICCGRSHVNSGLGENLAAKTCSCTNLVVAKPGAPWGRVDRWPEGPGTGWAAGGVSRQLLTKSPCPLQPMSSPVPAGPPSVFGSRWAAVPLCHLLSA